MAPPSRWHELKSLLRTELQHLTAIHPSDRLWQMCVAAALATGLPLLAGAYFNRLDDGLVSSLGGLVFLYLPGTPLWHRIITLMACAFAMSACYTMGLLSHFAPALMMPTLIFIIMLMTMVCRFFNLGPPGSLFFIMAAAIGAHSPTELQQIPRMVGLMTIGTLLACLVAFFYSLYALRLRAPKPVVALPTASFDFVIVDSVMIGIFVGIALALAQALQLQKAYWVPISCLAVIQGASLRAIWNRQLQRIIGTGIGLLVSWAILSLPLNQWRIALLIMSLTLIIEMVVVRHYAIAVAFITPLTILLAEAATLGQGSIAELMQARFLDTVLGCLVGLLGGICLHNPRFREALGTPMRKLIPKRLGQ